VGDEVTYALPGTDVVLSIEGSVHVRSGRTVSITHGRFGSVRFARDEVTYVRTASDPEAIPKAIRDAAAAKDAQALLAAARLALKAGRPDWFRQALASLNEFAAGDATVARATRFAAAYGEEPPSWDRTAFEKSTFGAGPLPDSFVGKRCLLYLIDPAPNPESKELAQHRLALMERVSETFFFLLVLDDVEVTLPSRPLIGVWCADAADFRSLRESYGPKLAEATGFFSADSGASFFFDQSTGTRFSPYFSLAAALQQERKQAKAEKWPNFDEIARRADATQLVARAAKERADIETVVHESVHQLVVLSGLLPTDPGLPRSLHEGLATYFEGYGGEGWPGPGTLLKERHARLLKLQGEPNAYSIADVFDDGARMGGAKLEALDAYAYAWGATHFLAETRPAAFYRFCRSVAQESRGGKLPSERLRQLLADATATDLQDLDAAWRAYIRALAPDQEKQRQEKQRQEKQGQEEREQEPSADSP
jgi:hypothetical protein